MAAGGDERHPPAVLEELARAFPLSPEQVSGYRRDGFVRLKGVLSPGLVHHFEPIVSRAVLRLNDQDKPMAERSTYERAFLQVTNLWEAEPDVRALVVSARLARIAAELTGAAGIRLYHDQALYKEPGGGITPYHADQYYWPLQTDRTATVWIPLQATPLEMGPLAFAARSHGLAIGRDLPISDQSEQRIQEELDRRGLATSYEPFELGEVSFHAGWVFHRANPNQTDRPRAVMTVIYMDKDARLAEPVRQEQESDWRRFLPGAEVGGPAASPLNPLLYDAVSS